MLCAEFGVTTVPKRYQGQITLGGVVTRLRTSKRHCGNCRPEGFVLRSDSADWLRARAKIVQPESEKGL